MAGVGDEEVEDAAEVVQLPTARNASTNRHFKKMRNVSRLRIPSLEEIAVRVEPKWTVYSGSQNLATALNDPSNREYDLFTKTWGSYFVSSAAIPPTNIPDIDLSDFLCYLKETAHVS